MEFEDNNLDAVGVESPTFELESSPITKVETLADVLDQKKYASTDAAYQKYAKYKQLSQDKYAQNLPKGFGLTAEDVRKFQEAEQIMEQAKRNQDAWFDPKDGTVSTTANIGVSIGASAVNTATDIVTSPAAYAANQARYSLLNPKYRAQHNPYARNVEGIEGKEDPYAQRLNDFTQGRGLGKDGAIAFDKMSDEEKEAMLPEQAPTYSPEELTKLEASVFRTNQRLEEGAEIGLEDEEVMAHPSYKDVTRMHQLEGVMDNIRGFKDSVRSVVNTKNVEALAADARDSVLQAEAEIAAGNIGAGILEYIKGYGKAAINNPAGALQVMGDTLPYMYALAAAPGIATAGLSLTGAEESKRAFIEEYHTSPSREQLNNMLGLNILAVAIEKVPLGKLSPRQAILRYVSAAKKKGQMIPNKFIKRILKSTSKGKLAGTVKGMDNAAAKAVSNPGKYAVDTSVVGQTIRGVKETAKMAGKGASVVAEESFQEGIQSVLTQRAAKKDWEDVDYTQAKVEAIIGGIAGVGFQTLNFKNLKSLKERRDEISGKKDRIEAAVHRRYDKAKAEFLESDYAAKELDGQYLSNESKQATLRKIRKFIKTVTVPDPKKGKGATRTKFTKIKLGARGKAELKKTISMMMQQVVQGSDYIDPKHIALIGSYIEKVSENAGVPIDKDLKKFLTRAKYTYEDFKGALTKAKKETSRYRSTADSLKKISKTENAEKVLREYLGAKFSWQSLTDDEQHEHRGIVQAKINEYEKELGQRNWATQWAKSKAEQNLEKYKLRFEKVQYGSTLKLKEKRKKMLDAWLKTDKDADKLYSIFKAMGSDDQVEIDSIPVEALIKADKAGKLTEDQAEQLADFVIKKTAAEVSNNIRSGGKDNAPGIDQHKDNMLTAIGEKNERVAKSILHTVNVWLTHQREKLKLDSVYIKETGKWEKIQQDSLRRTVASDLAYMEKVAAEIQTKFEESFGSESAAEVASKVEEVQSTSKKESEGTKSSTKEVVSTKTTPEPKVEIKPSKTEPEIKKEVSEVAKPKTTKPVTDKNGIPVIGSSKKKKSAPKAEPKPKVEPETKPEEKKVEPKPEPKTQKEVSSEANKLVKIATSDKETETKSGKVLSAPKFKKILSSLNRVTRLPLYKKASDNTKVAIVAGIKAGNTLVSDVLTGKLSEEKKASLSRLIRNANRRSTAFIKETLPEIASTAGILTKQIGVSVSKRDTSIGKNFQGRMSEMFEATNLTGFIQQYSESIFGSGKPDNKGLEGNFKDAFRMYVAERTPEYELTDADDIVIDMVAELVQKFSEQLNGPDSILYAINEKSRMYAVKGSKNKRMNAYPYEKNAIRDAFTFLISTDKQAASDRTERYVDGSIVLALALSSVDWLYATGVGTKVNSEDDIRSMFGIDSKQKVKTELMEAMEYGGTLRTREEESIGAAVFKHLGLKPKDKKYNELRERLEISLGELSLTLLNDLGLIQEAKTDFEEMLALQHGLAPITKDKKEIKLSRMVRISLDNENKILKDVADKLDAENAKGSSVMTTAFAEASTIKFPSKEPQEMKKGTRKKRRFTYVPDNVVDSLNKEQQRPNRISVSALADLKDDVITDEMLLEIEGYDSMLEDETRKIHRKERASIKGKNKGLLTQLDNLKAFLSTLPEDKDQTFFFTYDPWGTGRVGTKENGLNNLSSKIHRWAVAKDSWLQTYDMSNAKHKMAFKLAVLSGFKIDIEVPPSEIDAEYTKLMRNPKLIAGVSALQELRTGVKDVSKRKSLQKVLLEAVASGKEEMLSLKVIQELASVSEVVTEHGSSHLKVDNSFTSDITLEVDGKSNGAAIALLQAVLPSFKQEEAYPGMVNKLMQACGIYRGGEFSSWPEWRKTGQADIYELMSSIFSDYFSHPKNYASLGIPQGRKNTITFNRKFSKYKVIKTIFGAGIKALYLEISDDIEDQIYDEMMEWRSMDPQELIGNKQYELFQVYLRNIFGKEFEYPTFPEDFLFSYQQREMLREYVEVIYESPMETSMEKIFGGVKAYKKKLDKLSAVAYISFLSKFEPALEKKKAEVAKERGYEANLIKQDIYEVLEDLEEFLPIMGEPNSEGIKDSIMLFSEAALKDGPDSVQQSYSRKIGGTYESTTTSLRRKFIDEMGGKAFINAVHHTDFAVQRRVMEEFDVLNVHDATIGSPLNYMERAQAHNKALFEISRDYNPLESLLENTQRLVETTHKAAGQTKYKDLLHKLSRSEDTVDQILESAKGYLYYINKEKKAIFEDPNTVYDNYIAPGGAYSVNNKPSVSKSIGSLVEGNDLTAIPSVEEEFSMLSEAELEAIREHTKDVMDAFNAPGSTKTKEYTHSMDKDITSKSALDIFKSLGAYGVRKDSKEHTSFMEGMIQKLIAPVLETVGELTLSAGIFVDGDKTSGSYKDRNIMLRANKYVSPTAMGLSAQQIYVHELVHAITIHVMNKEPKFIRDLDTIYQKAKENTSYEMFLSTVRESHLLSGGVNTLSDAEAKAQAQVIWDHIFENEDGHNLAEFLATALSQPALFEHLSKNEMYEMDLKVDSKFPAQVAAGERSLMSLLKEVWSNLVKAFDKLVMVGRTKNGKAVSMNEAEYLMEMVKDINAVNAKHSVAAWSVADKMSSLDDKINTKVKNFVGDKLGFDKNTATDKFYGALKYLRVIMGVKSTSFIIRLFRECFEGTNYRMVNWHELLRKAKYLVDQNKQQAYDATKKYIEDNYHTELSKEESNILFRSLLKLDLQSLFNVYGERTTEDPLFNRDAHDIQKMFSDSSYLEAEILKMRQELSKQTGIDGIAYINEAMLTGYFLVTSKAKAEEVQLNAHNIFHFHGNAHKKADSKLDAEKIIPMIDSLITAYGILYSSDKIKTKTAEIIEREFKSDKNRNGITVTLDHLKNQQKDSKKALFNGSPELMVKGYAKETMDPNMAIKVGTLKEGEEFKKDGYVLHSKKPLAVDGNAAKGEPRYMYVTYNAGMLSRERTIMSVTNMDHMGTSIGDTLAPEDKEMYPGLVAQHARSINMANQSALKNRATKPITDIHSLSGEYYVPIRNEKGKSVDYRYMMKEETKIGVLRQDENLAMNIASIDQSMADKINSKTINERGIDQMYEDFKKFGLDDSSAFVEISNTSRDGAQYKDLYRMLPYETRKYIKRVWGKDRIMVRADMVDFIFGRRKATVLNSKVFGIEIGRGINKMIQVGMLPIWNKLFPALKYEGTLPLKTLERRAQEGVTKAKETIVIRTLSVMTGNVVSNTMVLRNEGMTLKNAIAYQIEGYRLIVDYQKQLSKANSIKLRLKNEVLTPAKKKNLERLLKKVVMQYETNPAHTLVKEGIFQSIVEDIEPEKNTNYATSAKLLEIGTDWLDKHNAGIVGKGAKQVYMTQDTSLYKLLYKMTQYGDFVSRYAMYKHLSDKKGLGKMSKTSPEYKTAFREILNTLEEDFIQYDIPTSKELQWMNDTGFAIFTKFLFRIQKVMLKKLLTKPITSTYLMLMQSFLGVDVSSIDDYFLDVGRVVNRITTPFSVIWDNLFRLNLFELEI